MTLVARIDLRKRGWAVATKLAHPDKKVIHLTGDGAFFHGVDFLVRPFLQKVLRVEAARSSFTEFLYIWHMLFMANLSYCWTETICIREVHAWSPYGAIR